MALKEGILHRVWYPQSSAHPVYQLVAPKQIRKRVMNELHGGVGGGHLGTEKLLWKVRMRFYWIGYKEDIRRWCKQCDPCSLHKPGPRRPRAQLHPFHVGSPLEVVSVDIMGPFKKSRRGNEYVLVVCDYFTKWTEAYSLRSHTAPIIADKLVEEFMFRFGVPHQLHSDQGADFDSDLIHEVCKLLRIHKTRTTAYHPQGNGLVERANRTIKKALQILVDETGMDWDDHLPYIMVAYRSSVHATTKCTPNLLMLNRETNLPIDLIHPIKSEDRPICPVKYVEWVRQAAEYAFEYVRNNMCVNQERQRRNYNIQEAAPSYKVGEQVLWHYPPVAQGKLGQSWVGPFVVTERYDDVNYWIQNRTDGVERLVHVDQIKSYDGLREAPAGVLVGNRNRQPVRRAKTPKRVGFQDDMHVDVEAEVVAQNQLLGTIDTDKNEEVLEAHEQRVLPEVYWVPPEEVNTSLSDRGAAAPPLDGSGMAGSSNMPDPAVLPAVPSQIPTRGAKPSMLDTAVPTRKSTRKRRPNIDPDFVYAPIRRNQDDQQPVTNIVTTTQPADIQSITDDDQQLTDLVTVTQPVDQPRRSGRDRTLKRDPNFYYDK